MNELAANILIDARVKDLILTMIVRISDSIEITLKDDDHVQTILASILLENGYKRYKLEYLKSSSPNTQTWTIVI